MSTNFSDLMNTAVESAKRVTIPVGTYAVKMKSFRETVSAKKKTKGTEVVLGFISAGLDVDRDALREFEASRSLKDQKITHTFWIPSADSLVYLRDFIEACGVSIEGRTFRQALSECVGSTVNAYVGHEAAQRDPSIALARVQSFSKVA